MTKKAQEQFVKVPRDLLRSEAWQSCGINERRILDFLMLEHLRHYGRRNGGLVAPHQQLAKHGVGASYIAPAFRNLEVRGLVTCRRQYHSPTTYALTWLPSDGLPPTNEWRRFSAKIKPRKQVVSSKNQTTQTSGLGATQTSGLTPKSENPETLPVNSLAESNHANEWTYLDRLYQGGADLSVESIDMSDEAAPLRVVSGARVSR